MLGNIRLLHKLKETMKGKSSYLEVIIENQQQEIDKLNNIINELEVFLKEGTELATGCGITKEYIYAYENALDKLKELKEEEL